ncbi:MAG: ABC-F family ATP-binding cassette domain-containing protein [Bacteroidales bacterium]|nr:ABC-F family ATP-binding cassette domain-containing protein [Bacteroidales bacterium]
MTTLNYLLVENISKSYGEKVLFENLTFGIDKGQKVALISKNGAGKSTLINIIMGKTLADNGKVTFRKDIRVAYLPQNPVLDESLTIEDVTIKSLRQQGWEQEIKLKEILSRLEIKDLSARISELSGGQKKKVALSKILMEETDLLILDEPTNHLDLEMTEWLEDYLHRRNMTLLLVTHDRTFLNHVCTEILELDHHQIYRYKGKYDYFLEKKAEREAIERAEVEKAKNTYRRELDWMRRMPSARGTKAKAREDNFYKVKEVAHKKLDEKTPELSILAERLGGKILEMYNVSKHYDDIVVLDDFSHVFKRGEKVGIVGRNGTGKSTFLNLITEKISPDQGKIIIGQTVKFGYYTQDGMPDREDMRVIDIIKETAEYVKMGNGNEISASQFLTYFGFPPTTQYNYFSNLSGGERRKLYLLKVLMSNPNFLILDEPTNDLDIYTLMMLEEFLSQFQGCLVIVTHDRSFMDNLVDHIFVFEGNGKVKDYHSTYTEYRRVKDKQERLKQQENKLIQSKNTISEKPIVSRQKLTYKEQKELEQLEVSIADLEAEKVDIEQKLSLAEGSVDELTQWSNRIGEVIRDLDVQELRWLELSERN